MNRRFARKGLQYLIGGVLFLSAFAKALDISGFATVLRTYQAFPESLLLPLAVTITISEMLLGGWIVWGRKLQTSSTAAAIMNLCYAGWMWFALWRGLTLSNCGCFGVFFPRPLTWVTPVEDVIFAGLCLLLRQLAGHPKNNRAPRV